MARAVSFLLLVLLAVSVVSAVLASSAEADSVFFSDPLLETDAFVDAKLESPFVEPEYHTSYSDWSEYSDAVDDCPLCYWQSQLEHLMVKLRSDSTTPRFATKEIKRIKHGIHELYLSYSLSQRKKIQFAHDIVMENLAALQRQWEAKLKGFKKGQRTNADKEKETDSIHAQNTNGMETGHSDIEFAFNNELQIDPHPYSPVNQQRGRNQNPRPPSNAPARPSPTNPSHRRPDPSNPRPRPTPHPDSRPDRPYRPHRPFRPLPPHRRPFGPFIPPYFNPDFPSPYDPSINPDDSSQDPSQQYPTDSEPVDPSSGEVREILPFYPPTTASSQVD